MRKSVNMLIGIALLVAMLFPGTAEAVTLKQYLNRYVGSWAGQMEVATADGRMLRRMHVSITYAWRGKELHGTAIYTEQGHETRAGIRMFVDTKEKSPLRGQLLYEMTYPGLEPQVYVGRVSGDIIYWTPPSVIEAKRKQFYDTVVKKDGTLYLMTNGTEKIERGTTLYILSARAELKKQ